MSAVIHRNGSAPHVAKSARSLARTAPELWAEQERRRLMLEKEGVAITYRRATALPPTGELRRIIIERDKLEANEPRELRFIGETIVKMWVPPRKSYRWWAKTEGARVVTMLQEMPCYVADVGQGVILGFVVAQGDYVYALYVKSDFRGAGIGLGLLRAAGVTVPLRVPRVTNSWRHWTRYHQIPWNHEGGTDAIETEQLVEGLR